MCWSVSRQKTLFQPPWWLLRVTLSKVSSMSGWFNDLDVHFQQGSRDLAQGQLKARSAWCRISSSVRSGRFTDKPTSCWSRGQGQLIKYSTWQLCTHRVLAAYGLTPRSRRCNLLTPHLPSGATPGPDLAHEAISGLRTWMYDHLCGHFDPERFRNTSQLSQSSGIQWSLPANFRLSPWLWSVQRIAWRQVPTSLLGGIRYLAKY